MGQLFQIWGRYDNTSGRSATPDPPRLPGEPNDKYRPHDVFQPVARKEEQAQREQTQSYRKKELKGRTGQELARAHATRAGQPAVIAERRQNYGAAKEPQGIHKDVGPVDHRTVSSDGRIVRRCNATTNPITTQGIKAPLLPHV